MENEVKNETNVTSAPTNAEVTNPVTPAGQGPAKAAKGGFAGIIIAAAIVVVLLFVGVGYKVATSSPKAVFKSNINNVYKKVSKELKDADKLSDQFDIEEKALYVKGDIKLDTNVEDITDEIGEIKDLKLGFEGGIDLKNEELLGGVSVTGKKETISGTIYYTDETAYIKSSIMDEIVKISSEELDDVIDFEDLKEEYDEIKDQIDVDPETYDYLIKTMKDALIKSLDSKSMEKGKGSFEVDGKKVNATKVSYVFTKSSTKELANKVVEELLNNDEFLSKLAKSTGVDKADIKDGLKEVKDSIKEIDFDGEYRLNVYTKGLLNKTVGLSIEYKDKEYISVYKNGKTTEMIFDNHQKDDYGQTKIVVLAVEKKDETEVSVKYNKNEIATATIRELSDEVIDLDFKIKEEDETIKGSVYLSAKQKKNVISGDYKVRLEYEDEYVAVSGSYSVESQDKLNGFSTKDAVDAEDIDTEKLSDNLEKVLEKDETLSGLFDAIGEEIMPEPEPEPYTPSTTSYIESLYFESDLQTKLKEEKALVIYVGYTYYSDREASEKAFVEYLTNNRESKKYALYSVSPSWADEFEDELPGAYDKNPAAYFFKDGKLVKTLYPGGNVSEIADAIQEITSE